MIEHVSRLVCDLCGEELKTNNKCSHADLLYFARKDGWEAKSEGGMHYCVNCKVPARLAREKIDFLCPLP